MAWFRNQTYLMRFLTLLLTLILVFSIFIPVTTFAADEDEDIEVAEEDKAGSYYVISTALTAWADAIMGVNAPDSINDSNRGDLHADPHTLYAVAYGGIGDAGAVVGFGEAKDSGYMGQWGMSDVNNTTTFPYTMFLDRGDGGRVYNYARYGKLLNDLGLDEVNAGAQENGSRTVGHLISVAYDVAAFVPTVFDVAMRIMETLNPFRFLIQPAATGSHTRVNEAFVQADAEHANQILDPFTNAEQDLQYNDNDALFTSTTEIPLRDVMDNVDEFENTSTLKTVAETITHIYVFMQSVGTFLILPLLLAFLLASILMRSRPDSTSTWNKIFNYAKKFVFIVVGIPLLGMMYTSALQSLHAEVVSESPSNRVIALTFLDFQNWVVSSRLEPVSGATLESRVTVNNRLFGGEPTADSWRTVRNSIYAINVGSGSAFSDFPDAAGMGFANKTDTEKQYEQMVSGERKDSNGNIIDFGATSDQRQVMQQKLNSVLSIYGDGQFYQAANWAATSHSNTESQLSKYAPASVGTPMADDDSSVNKTTLYAMYSGTDTPLEWVGRKQSANAAIFNGGTKDGWSNEDAEWCSMNYNIFSNGSNLGVLEVDSADVSSLTGNGVNVLSYGVRSGTNHSGGESAYGAGSTNLGLSSLSMYNYLASKFDSSGVTVSSGLKTATEYGLEQHYAVTSAGSGSTRFLFLLNTIVVLLVFAVIGIAYCFGTVIHNVKQGISMILSIPMAMMGVMRSIVQIITYVIMMIIELLVMALLYSLITEFVFSFATIIETEVAKTVTQLSATGFAGGMMAMVHMPSVLTNVMESKLVFGIGLAAVITGVGAISYFAIRLQKVFQMVWAYVWLRMLRIATLPVALPWFDEFVAGQNSIYVWDSIRMDMQALARVIRELTNHGPVATMKGSAVQ